MTPYFNKSGNTALITASQPKGGLYGAVLVVVYEDASQPLRKIWLDEGCDTVYVPSGSSNGASFIGYAMFNNVTAEGMSSARLTNIVPSGVDNPQSTVIFNAQDVAITGSEGSDQSADPGFKYYDVTSALKDGTNELGIRNDGSWINLAAAILQVEYGGSATMPVTSFTSSTASGTAPYTVVFTDTSTNTPTSWLWDFGDNDATNATKQNPVHTYASAGTYTVNLTATNAAGSNSSKQAGYVTVTGGSGGSGAPVAAFTTSSSTNDLAGSATATFTDASTNTPTSWTWEYQIADTGTWTVFSTSQNPAFTPGVAGTYNIRLNATNSNGSNTVTKPHVVSVANEHDYLTTVGSGTVSGDLFVNSVSPFTTTASPTFTLPSVAVGNITWARLYVDTYSGSYSSQYGLTSVVKVNGNTVGNETLDVWKDFSTDKGGYAYPVNDHVMKVMSDYEATYNVTSLITTASPTVTVTSSSLSGYSFDGRIKGITLIAAYNDGD